MVELSIKISSVEEESGSELSLGIDSVEVARVCDSEGGMTDQMVLSAVIGVSVSGTESMAS